MKAKEKAKELVDMFQYDITEPQDYIRMSEDDAIESALICVDRILDAVAIDPVLKEFGRIADKRFDFYTEVKQEINKL